MAGDNQDKSTQRSKTSQIFRFAKGLLICCSPFTIIAYGLKLAHDKDWFHVPYFKAGASISNPNGRGVAAAWVLSVIFWAYGGIFFFNPIAGILIGALICGIVAFADKVESKKGYQKMKEEVGATAGNDGDANDHQAKYSPTPPVRNEKVDSKAAESCRTQELRQRNTAGVKPGASDLPKMVL